MAMKIFQLVVLLSILVLCSSSVKLNHPAVFNFGDSNSDTGNVVAGLGFVFNPPYGRKFVGQPAARACDGRLIVDFLMYAMDFPFLNAYLQSLGLPNFHTGCNFAAAGATIQPATTDMSCPFSFGIQVKQFLRFKARVLSLVSKSKKLDEYIPAEEYFYKGLYMFDIGQNDLTIGFLFKSYEKVIASIPDYLAEFEAGIQRLYNEGARHFWIHNTGPLGCLPQMIALFGTSKSSLDEVGCVQTHNLAAKIFNHRLHGLCRKMQGEYSDINITYVDIFTIKSDLIRHYYLYGFKHPSMACCRYDGPPIDHLSWVNCGTTVVVNGTSVSAKGCNERTKYVSWDGIHYTEAANQHVASQILTGKYTNPSFLDMLPYPIP